MKTKSNHSVFFKRFDPYHQGINILTYQPDNDCVVAHLRSSMEWCHAIIGSDSRIRSTILDQVLDNLKMTFLAGQVEWCGTILSLGVDNTTGTDNGKVSQRLIETRFL